MKNRSLFVEFVFGHGVDEYEIMAASWHGRTYDDYLVGANGCDDFFMHILLLSVLWAKIMMRQFWLLDIVDLVWARRLLL